MTRFSALFHLDPVCLDPSTNLLIFFETDHFDIISFELWQHGIFLEAGSSKKKTIPLDPDHTRLRETDL
jgi:hypothetical protein